MEITDFSRGYWAMSPGQYDILAAKVAMLTPDVIAEKKAAFAARTVGADELEIRDGVAIIPVTGSITSKETWLSVWLGATAMDRLALDFQAAEDDPAVDATVFKMDSPGGTIPGVVHMSSMIAKSKKPVVSFVDSLMASAAYWPGSHSDSILISSTAEVGSIGILMVHADYSEMDKKMGVTRSFLTAGKYKAVGNSAEPLTEESRKILQEELDYLYDIFTASVAKGRNTTQDDVLKNMADGRIFIGQQAVDAGLADEVVGSLDDAIQKAIDLVPDSNGTYTTKSSQSGKEQAMTLAELIAKYPDLAKQLKQEGIDSVDVAEAVTEAVSAQATRLKGLAVAKFGEEGGTAFATLVDTDVTPEQFAAIAGTTPAPAAKKNDDGKQAILDGLHKAEADDPGAGGGGGSSPKDYMALVAEYQATHKCNQFEAMNAVGQAHPEARKAYLEAAQKK